MYVSTYRSYRRMSRRCLSIHEKKTLYNATFGVRSTAIGCPSAEDAIAVAIGGARVLVGRRIVPFVGVKWGARWSGNDGGGECRLQKAHVRLVAGRTEQRVRYTLIVDSSRELGGHAASIGRVATDTIHAIHILHKCGIDAAVARPLTPPPPPPPPMQAEQAFVGKTEESGVDPLVHGLKHGDVRNSGRWAKVAPLHAGSYDAHDVIVSFVEA